MGEQLKYLDGDQTKVQIFVNWIRNLGQFAAKMCKICIVTSTRAGLYAKKSSEVMILISLFTFFSLHCLSQVANAIRWFWQLTLKEETLSNILYSQCFNCVEALGILKGAFSLLWLYYNVTRKHILKELDFLLSCLGLDIIKQSQCGIED